MSLFSSFYQLLDFSPILMTGNELNPGDHLGGSEPQNHKLELRKVSCGIKYKDIAKHLSTLFRGTGSRFSACSLTKLLFSNLLLILSVNNPTHMYLSDLRVYFKVEVYFRVT